MSLFSITLTGQQTIIFQNGFEGSTDIVPEIVQVGDPNWNRNDVIGVDDNNTDPPNNWDYDLPNYASHIGEYYIMYEHVDNINTEGDMVATIEDDPTDSNFPNCASPCNQVMSFEIKKHNGTSTMNDDVVGRVQANIYNDSDHRYGGAEYQEGLKNFHYTTRLLIPNDFNLWLNNTSSDFMPRMTIAEFFNYDNSSNLHPGMRITVQLFKDDGDNRFRLRIKSDTKAGNGSSETWSSSTDDAWIEESDPIIGVTGSGATFELGQWLTMDVTYEEGDGNSGFFQVQLINGSTTEPLSVTNWTRNMDEERNDGIHFLNPHKLYVRGEYVQEFMDDNEPGGQERKLKIYWDDFNFDSDVLGKSGCASIRDVSFDAEENVGNGSMTISGSSGANGLNIGNHIVGLQFFGFSLPAGAEITDASLHFSVRTANDVDDDDITVNIQGEYMDPDSPTNPDQVPLPYDDDTGYDISNRPLNALPGQIVPWNIPIWTQEDEEREKDITDVINGILSEHQGDFEPQDIFSLVLTPSSGTSQRIAYAYDSEPDQAPRLCITFRVYGEVYYHCNNDVHFPDINVTVRPTGNDPCENGDYDTVVDDQGHYDAQLCGEVAEYKVLPRKWNQVYHGVNGLAVWYVNRFVNVYTNYLQEPHQRIAADVVVDANQVIDAADRDFLLQFVLHQASIYPAWTFLLDGDFIDPGVTGVPTYTNFIQSNYANAVDNTADFEMVKMGDVNCKGPKPISPPVSTFEVPGGTTDKDAIFETSLSFLISS